MTFNKTTIKEINVKDKTDVVSVELGSQDISGKTIVDIMGLPDSIAGKLNELPSTQNTFGSNASCYTYSAINRAKPYLYIGYPSTLGARNMPESDFDALVERIPEDKRLSDTWEDVKWTAVKDSSKQELAALIYLNNKGYAGKYMKAGKESIYPERCVFYPKKEADFIFNALKAAYPDL